MMCPHCQKDNPDYATICVWCGRSLVPGESSDEEAKAVRSAKKRIRIIVALALVCCVAVAALCAAVFKAQARKELIGTWKMDIPVGELMNVVLGESEDESVLQSLLTAVAGDDVTVTLYCRFYENNTYTVYVDSEDLAASLEKMTDNAVRYICEDGIFEILEKQGVSKENTEMMLGLVGLSTDTLADVASETVSEWMQPVYEELKKTLSAPQETAGERYYELDEDRLYLALEKDKRIEDSLYIVLSFDGTNIRLITGTAIDQYVTTLEWSKVE